MFDFTRGVIGSSRPARAIGAQAGMLGRLLTGLNLWFWALVGVPTLLAGVYFFAIAAPLYGSEAKFIVRGPNMGAQATSISALLQSAAGSGAQDVYAVQEYLTSRDAVERLARQDNLRAIFNRPEGDALTRFPGVRYWRTDSEALYDAYQRFVSIDIDATTGVSTLLVKAYRPDDAQMLARDLLRFSEELVNQLNERAHEDAIGTFRSAVKADEQRLTEAQEALTFYRIKHHILDPKTAAGTPLEVLVQLSNQLAAARRQLADTMQNSPKSPQIPLIKSRIASLEQTVADERSKLTGKDDSVATVLSEYERLELRRQLAEKALQADTAALGTARLQAQRQDLYLETIAQPNFSDYPIYPKRVASFLTVMVGCLLTYGIGWLLVAGIREHAAP
jgi:capsular polysaccharide transport system permease protein